MRTICDTGSIMMLVRIAPDMFTDSRFGCATIPEVREEIFQTQRLKSKYPWRTQYKKNIVPLSTTEMQSAEFVQSFDVIISLLSAGIINGRTSKFFNLSHVDQKVAAGTIANNCRVSTVDKELADFLSQEFSTKNVSPLGLLNIWLQERLLTWNQEMHLFLQDWSTCNEPAQPKKDVWEFEKNTNHPYEGP